MKTLVLFTIFTLVFGSSTPEYDVCVMGAGAFGMATAVFAKDHGKTVLVIEKSNHVGGHCNTIPIPTAPPGYPTWLDIGVQIIPNTTYANLAYGHRWNVDTVAYVERFAGTGAAIPVDFTSDTIPNFIVDAALGYTSGPIPPTPPTPAFLAAFARLTRITRYTYPWLDTGHLIGPVPPELLVPFTDFVEANDLGALIGDVFIPQLFDGGLGTFMNLTTVYALRNLAPTIEQMFTVPGGGFEIQGGCGAMYDGIVDYLGSSNVMLNAQVVKAIRSPLSIFQPIRLKIQVEGKITWAKCRNLVVAFPQVEAHLGFMDLDIEERSLWSSIQVREYFTGLVSLEGPIAANPAYSLSNVNLLNPPYNTPSSPAWINVDQILPYAPAAIYSFSDTPISVADITALISSQLAAIPPALVTSASLTQVIEHQFQAHPSNAALADPIGFYTRVKLLQGHRRTYWGGAGTNYAAHHVLINDAFNLEPFIV